MSLIFNVFDHQVIFTEEEQKALENVGLELDDNFLEVILNAYEVDSFNGMNDEQIHTLCIDAIENYTALVRNTISFIKRKDI